MNTTANNFPTLAARIKSLIVDLEMAWDDAKINGTQWGDIILVDSWTCSIDPSNMEFLNMLYTNYCKGNGTKNSFAHTIRKGKFWSYINS